MRDGWKECTLENGVLFKNGKKRPDVEGDYPVYGGNGILGYTNDFNNENVVVIGRVGAYCGSVYYEPAKCWISDNAISAQSRSETIIRYIYYLLSSLQLNSRHIGTSQPLLTQEILNSIETILPPLTEQRAIATTLSCLDDKIELNNKINANLEAQAQAIFKSWFVDFEPFQDGEFVDSELGIIPKGWRVGKFTDVVKVLGGGTPKTDNAAFWNGDIPFFTPKDVNGVYTLTTEKWLTNDGVNNCNSSLYSVNTVFITARGTVGKIALAGCEMAMNQSCYALVGKEGYGQLFVYGLAQIVVDSLKHKSSGAVFNAIVTRDFDSEYVIIPDIKVAARFEDLASPIYDSILQNTKQSQTLAALRDALLPKLMSGEIEVTIIGEEM